MNTRPALPQVADGRPEPIWGAEAQKGVVLHDDVGRAAEAEGYARKIPGEPSILSLFEQGRDTLDIAEQLSLPEHVVAKALHIERSAALGREAAFGPRFRGRAERREMWLREIEAAALGWSKARYMITLNIGAA